MADPWAKWPGGKRSALDALRPHLPTDLDQRWLCEPFFGSGGFGLPWGELFAGAPVFADACAPLVLAHKGVRDHPEAVLAWLRKTPIKRATFDRVRDNLSKVVRTGRGDSVKVAAWFIYLNRCGFNGLWRVSSKDGGTVNTPWGDREEGSERLGDNAHVQKVVQGASVALRDMGARLHCLSFRSTLERLLSGAWGPPEACFLFVDSPYWNRQDPGTSDLSGPTEKESFTAYTAEGWGTQDAVDLLRLLVRCREAGVSIMATNHWHEGWVARYREAGFEAHPFEVRRSISQDAETRGNVTEVVFTA